MRTDVPKHVKWAAGIFMASGGVLVLLALLLLTLSDVRPDARLLGALGVALIGAGLIGLGLRLRARERWAHRLAVALVLLQVAIGVVGMFRGRAGLPWLPAVVLWLLLRAPTRRWFSGEPLTGFQRAPNEPSLAKINERFAQRPSTRD